MTIAEFYGCTFLAFGPPLAMFVFTIAHDPIRIIILIAAAFVWLLALLMSSLLWFVVVPLRTTPAFGMVFSVFIQEAFRYAIYKILRKTESGWMEFADNTRITENKHILAYVAGLGFGIISGAFALINVLADAVGPATMGLIAGSSVFFITSAAQTLCMILLHIFWSIIFFNACDNLKWVHINYVVISHLAVSALTLLNRQELYVATLLPSYFLTIFTGIFAFKVAGGSFVTFKRFVTCK